LDPATTDRELLALLEQAFAGHAGDGARIDVEALSRALGLNSPYLARRVLAVFDRNGDGAISQSEFIDGVRQLVFGSARDKLWFAFRLHDHNGDGFIDQTEMLRMISIAMAESEIAPRASQPAEYLTRILFDAVDSNRDGRISFDEFVLAIERRPGLLRQMTRSEAIWLVPNEGLLAWLDAPNQVESRALGRASGWATWLVLFLWLVANAAILGSVLLNGLALFAQNPLMQLGRALAACLELNGALILLPMLRRLLSKLRATRAGRFLPIDDAVLFHRVLGHTLFGLALAHGACFSVAYASGHASQSLGRLFLFTLPGASGLLLLVVFGVMWLCSLGFVRGTKRFELFYFTHLLYIAWFVLAVVHAPVFLIWAGLPLLGFAIEQVLRLYRRAPQSRVLRVRALRSAVTELEIERPVGFDFAPADYIFLRIPSIARHEWHPLTISSAPEQNRLSLHVRALGNWSGALRRIAEAGVTELTAYVDGPYGSPSAHIFRSRVAVLIGAGIGVTPFASVLGSIVARANGDSSRPSQLERAYFFWLNRDQYSFEWFAALLAELEARDRRGLLEIHLCMTGARATSSALGLELAREVMHASGRSDMITGLRTHTHVGRPDWEGLLGRIEKTHGPHSVDVYFCGPPGLARLLGPLCRRLGMTFREEKF
jgi:predicted ferric reductase/Ca2+-binding EF-hand superfamily protein